MRAMDRAIALALTASLAGCSYLSMPTIRNTTPYRNEGVAATCTTGPGAPLADLLGATIGGLFTVLALTVAYNEATHDYGEDDGIGYTVAAAVGIPFGGMFLGYGLSARHGERYIAACKAERRKPIYRSPRLRLADDLVTSARAAALRGDCTTTRALLVRAQRADDAVHAAGLRDDAIARCLARPSR
jgi:hypothetical protein